jgi:hypothetical protein
MFRGRNIGQGTCQHVPGKQRAVLKSRRYSPDIKVFAKNILYLAFTRFLKKHWIEEGKYFVYPLF